MKSAHRFLYMTILVLWTVLTVVGCSPAQTSTNPQLGAINNIRTHLDLPDLPIEYVEASTMINSPSGDLKVAIYRDSEGRKYLVDPESSQVVEIDARAVLPSISPDTLTVSQEELRAKAEKYVAETITDFDTLQVELSYEEGKKGDSYFFTWYGANLSGANNRPFAQIGLHRSGVLFAYYNTLMLK